MGRKLLERILKEAVDPFSALSHTFTGKV